MYPVMNNITLKLQPNDDSLMMIKKSNIVYTHNLNDSARSIMYLCNGKNSISDIINLIATKYNEEHKNVSEYVNEFIFNLKKYDIINMNSSPSNFAIDIRGSEEYYTPQVISLELTQKCPLRCIHCYIDAGGDMSINKEYIDIICNDIIRLGVQTVQLTGGEPLLHKNIIDILDYLTKNSVQIIVNTSGMIHDENIFEALTLLKNTNGFVQVSIDGLKESHNYIRQNQKSFDNAIQFTQKLIESKVRVCVATCVIDQSFEEIEQLCCMLRDMGVFEYRIGRLAELGRAKANGFKITVHKNEFVLNMIKVLNQKYKTEIFRIASTEDLDCEESSELSCGAGYKTLKICPNLDITPCAMSNLKIGNLSNETLEEACKRLNHIFPKMVNPNKNICNSCDNYYKCAHCLAQGLINKNSVSNCDWFNKNEEILSDILL